VNLDAILAELTDRYGDAPGSVLNLIDVTELRQQANRLGLKDVTLLGTQASFKPVELSEGEQVRLSHVFPGMRYLQTNNLLTVPAPKDAAGEPLRDRAVIDWTWTFLATVFANKENQ
jgi:transcription-repair coupling factor (superfamily II helicase)